MDECGVLITRPIFSSCFWLITGGEIEVFMDNVMITITAIAAIPTDIPRIFLSTNNWDWKGVIKDDLFLVIISKK